MQRCAAALATPTRRTGCWRPPSMYTTVSTMCSSTRGPAVLEGRLGKRMSAPVKGKHLSTDKQTVCTHPARSRQLAKRGSLATCEQLAPLVGPLLSHHHDPANPFLAHSSTHPPARPQLQATGPTSRAPAVPPP